MSEFGFIRRLLNTHTVRRVRKVTNDLFTHHLLLTNIGISMSLSGTGDVLQQQYQKVCNRQLAAYDCRRTFDLTLAGAAAGVVCHYWYLILDKKLPQATTKIVCKKIVLDQVCFSPVMWVVFFGTLAIAEGVQLKTFGEEALHKGKKIWLAEVLIWPPAQAVNFAFLPTKYRVLYDSIISLGFDVYVSYLKHHTSGKAVMKIDKDSSYS